MSPERPSGKPQMETAEKRSAPPLKPAEPPPEPTAPEEESPETAQRRRRRRWIWVVIIAVVALVAVLLIVRASARQAEAAKAAKAAPKPVPVVTAAARTGDFPVYLTGLGTVTPVSTVTVRSRVDGELVNVAFREGQLVREGALLAQIDPRPFQVQLIQAQGQMAKDQAALQNARLDLARYQALAAQDAIPRQQLDTQGATVAQSEAALETDRGQIESAKLNLVYSHITAPITGRIGLRLVDPGNMVHAADPNGLLVITQVQPITVIFTLPEDQLPQVRDRMHEGVKLEVDVFDRNLKKKLATGTLLTVDNQIDTTTGTVRLKAIFPNTDDALFPNQFVNPRLLIDTLKGVVIVPNAAVQRSPQSTFVYVVKQDASVEMRNVEVQLTEGDQTAVSKGLAAGETVVTDGVDRLQAGSKVEVARPGEKSEKSGKGSGKTGR